MKYFNLNDKCPGYIRKYCYLETEWIGDKCTKCDYYSDNGLDIPRLHFCIHCPVKVLSHFKVLNKIFSEVVTVDL